MQFPPLILGQSLQLETQIVAQDKRNFIVQKRWYKTMGLVRNCVCPIDWCCPIDRSITVGKIPYALA